MRDRPNRTMKPIEERADVSFMQALKCVQYRLPSTYPSGSRSYSLSLGLRYGLIGVAASHHLLITADDEEELDVLAFMESWPDMVEDHVRWELMDRLPAGVPVFPELIGSLSVQPLRVYLPLYRQLSPIDWALQRSCETYIEEHIDTIEEGWFWFQKRKSLRSFWDDAVQSACYARHFFDRRQADLEELPEIALIGE